MQSDKSYFPKNVEITYGKINEQAKVVSLNKNTQPPNTNVSIDDFKSIKVKITHYMQAHKNTKWEELRGDLNISRLKKEGRISDFEEEKLMEFAVRVADSHGYAINTFSRFDLKIRMKLFLKGTSKTRAEIIQHFKAKGVKEDTIKRMISRLVRDKVISKVSRNKVDYYQA